MNKGLMRIALVAVLATALWAGDAQATSLNALLEGAEEVPPANTPGSGLGAFVLNDVTNALSFQLEYSNLLGPTTMAHLHRAPFSQNGPVVYTLSAGNFASGLQGMVVIAPADIPLLLNDGFYCNIHTQAFPGGEIRGQVDVAQTPVEPSTWGKIKDLWGT